jgi:hypothetical protein
MFLPHHRAFSTTRAYPGINPGKSGIKLFPILWRCYLFCITGEGPEYILTKPYLRFSVPVVEQTVVSDFYKIILNAYFLEYYREAVSFNNDYTVYTKRQRQIIFFCIRSCRVFLLRILSTFALNFFCVFASYPFRIIQTV